MLLSKEFKLEKERVLICSCFRILFFFYLLYLLYLYCRDLYWIISIVDFYFISNLSFVSCYFHPYFLSYILHFVYSGSQIIRFIGYEKRLRSVCPAIMNQHPSLWEEGYLSYNYPVSLVTPQCIGVFVIILLL